LGRFFWFWLLFGFGFLLFGLVLGNFWGSLLFLIFVFPRIVLPVLASILPL